MSYPTKYHLPCDHCGSSDAVTLYDDGHTFCFSCNTDTQPQQNGERKEMETNVTPLSISASTSAPKPNATKSLVQYGEFRDLPNRSLSSKTLERFGVRTLTAPSGEIQEVIFPYYSSEGTLVAQKIRTQECPKGYWRGDPKSATFFGANIWKTGKKITIVEGEFDAIAVAEMMGDWPVISVRNGADRTGSGVVKEIQENYEFFRNFEEVILCFDNDEAGQASAEAAAKTLPQGKTKIVNFTKHKDANEYLKAGDRPTFNREFWSAKTFMPSGLVAGADLWEELREEKVYDAVPYPYEKLNQFTFGIRGGEMVTLVAGSGLGKSSIITDICHYLLKQDDTSCVGTMMLEESVRKSAMRFMSLELEKPLHVIEAKNSLARFEGRDEDLVVVTEEEKKRAFDATVGLKTPEGRSRLVMYDHFGSNQIEEILFRIRHMAAMGCRYIFLDHISIVVSDQSNADERKALDEIATKLRQLVEEEGICLFVVSHLKRPSSKPHEEGGQTSLADIRGTAGIGQLSDLVLGLERNGQAEDPIEKNTTRIRILKNRFTGAVGLTSSLFYDHTTGKITEIEESKKEDEQKQ